MNKKFCSAAFLLGLLTVAWVGFGYIGTNSLALIMTLIIAATFVTGAREMQRFAHATESLVRALAAIPADMQDLRDWLGRLHPALQNAVRLRIEGERVALPGPGLTPYLLGLLVMLGMLGTFLGMVVTLKGAVFALEGNSDLEAMRASLSAPIRGLGLAFGTSVAGVASSAMLGLISALCRRERQQAAQLLDAQIATRLRAFSLVHQRQETFKALQTQAQTLPRVVDQLQLMMEAMARQNQLLHERMMSNQEAFHRDAKSVYSALASSVDQSLRTSLTESAQAAGAVIKPVVEATMAAIAATTEVHQANMTKAVAQHLDGLSANLLTELGQREQQRLAALSLTFETMAASLQREWQQTGAQTMAEIGQLMQVAATAPRAAAEVIGQLREEISQHMTRDNTLLEERGRLMASLNVLLATINQGAGEQRSAIDALVASAASLFDRVGQQFTTNVDAEAARMAEMASQIGGSAVEVASLGETFGFAVGQFSAANDKMIEQLTRIETSLDQSMARSDEQMAYYVAQAREIIELSIAAQKPLVDQLQQLARVS